MSPLVLTLLAVLQQDYLNYSATSTFCHDFVRHYSHFGDRVELRSLNGHAPELLSKAIHQSQGITVSISTKAERTFVSRKELQIIVLRFEEDLQLEQFESVGMSLSDESRIAMFLPPGYSDQKIFTALRSCYLNNFGNCLAVVQRDENNPESVDLYYSPLEPSSNHRCTSKRGLPKLINRWVYQKGFQKKKFVDMPVIEDFKGCKLVLAGQIQSPYIDIKKFHRMGSQAQLADFTGMDVLLLDIIAKKNNFTVEIMQWPLSIGEKNNLLKGFGKEDDLKDGSGALEAIFQRKADIVAGGLFPTVFRYRSSDATQSYATDSLRWYVIANVDVTWHRFTSFLKPSVWVLLGISFCAASAVRLLVASKADDACPIMTLWGITTECGQHPAYRSLSEYVLAFAWIVFCLHVNTAYRAGLATSLAAGVIYTDMTPDDLYKSDYTLVMTDNLKHSFEDLLIDHRGAKVTCSVDKQHCLERMKRGKDNRGLLISSNFMKMRQSEFSSKWTGQPAIQNIRHGQVLTFPIQMFMVRGHIMKTIFDKYLGLLMNAGIPEHLITEARWKAQRRYRATYALKSNESLNFYMVKGAFWLLAVGLVLASLLAAVEIFCPRKFSTKMASLVER